MVPQSSALASALSCPDHYGPLPAQADITSYVMDVIVAHVSDSTDLTRFWSIELIVISSDEVEDRDAAMNLCHKNRAYHLQTETTKQIYRGNKTSHRFRPTMTIQRGGQRALYVD
ncbi:hypothetical protein DPMN_063985 [Dreissena polymorpha]|uniref:Uncharacterized protein n=1 Tax=Dreissena polymorpha TaxID=45954 RepID=A0A9D4HJ34_DREPO|nr:hypothetical protein DPMN_063985 [Dreissena polymorpha]